MLSDTELMRLAALPPWPRYSSDSTSGLSRLITRTDRSASTMAIAAVIRSPDPITGSHMMWVAWAAYSGRSGKEIIFAAPDYFGHSRCGEILASAGCEFCDAGTLSRYQLCWWMILRSGYLGFPTGLIGANRPACPVWP